MKDNNNWGTICNSISMRALDGESEALLSFTEGFLVVVKFATTATDGRGFVNE